MAFGTVNTILNTAPLIIQGATKLVRLLKDRKEADRLDRSDKTGNASVTVEELGKELTHIHTRLDANNQSDIEQIKMIEELAKQSEILARAQTSSIKLLKLVAVIAISAFTLCLYLAYKLL